MKPFAGYENVQVSDFEKLPKGAYEVKIMDAKEVTYTVKDGSTFSKLEIAFEIATGEFAGFYRRNFDAQTQEDKKWKGVMRLYIPKDDGTDKDEWTKKTFKRMMQAIEDSNPGYRWDWNEKGLKGKIVGCLYQNREWAYNGKTGWTAQPHSFIDVAKVRSGEFKLPEDKPLDVNQKPVSVDIATDADEEDLPF